MEIAVTINGTLYRRGVPADLSLLDWLQEDLGLTGTKFCCGIGVCRACTVTALRPLNSAATPLISCSTSLAMVDGTQITTIEGAAPPGGLRHAAHTGNPA